MAAVDTILEIRRLCRKLMHELVDEEYDEAAEHVRDLLDKLADIEQKLS